MRNKILYACIAIAVIIAFLCWCSTLKTDSKTAEPSKKEDSQHQQPDNGNADDKGSSNNASGGNGATNNLSGETIYFSNGNQTVNNYNK